jgi:hypothetical protein
MKFKFLNKIISNNNYMKIIFYSNKCDYSKKMLVYLENNNIKNFFKLVNIDQNSYPPEIDIVPTIIDTELNQPMKGKKAFEYLLNIKYFNNPTNNIEYNKNIIPRPNIPEDEKASSNISINLELVPQQNMSVTTNNKLAILMKLKKK